MITITNIGINGKIFVNGQEVNVTGRNIEIRSGKMFIDGTPIDQYDESKLPVFKIVINGDVDSIKAETGDITVNGNVREVTSKNGNVRCHTVEGNVDSKNGNVVCDVIKGDCDTKNGNIMRRN